MTYPPNQPGSQWQSQGGGYQPPQQPQVPYPQAPYAPQPEPGIAITAMVLCTLTCLCVVWSVIGLIVGDPFVLLNDVQFGFQFPAWATILNVIWSIGDILLIVGTIFMWCRNAVGRILAVAGLCLALAAVVSFELVAVSMPAGLLVRPWAWLIDVFGVLGLAFVLLPATGAYLKAGRRPPYPPAPLPPYPPAGNPPVQ